MPEGTIFKVEEILPGTTLGTLSFVLGETITECLDRGARKFTVSFGKDCIIIVCEKNPPLDQLVQQHGYDSERLYASLWRE